MPQRRPLAFCAASCSVGDRRQLAAVEPERRRACARRALHLAARDPVAVVLALDHLVDEQRLG